MVELYYKKSRNIKRRSLSLFLKFDYDKYLVNLMKKFSTKYYHKDTKEWELPYSTFKFALEVFKECEVCVVGKLPDEFEQYLNLLDKYESYDMLPIYKTTPFSHQEDCFNYAKTHPKFLLGDEQGLGKTKQSIDIAVSRKAQMNHCLIVCGVNGLKWNWLKEIEIHSNETGHILGSRMTRTNRIVIGSVNDRLADLKRPRDDFFLITNIESLRDKEFAKEVTRLCDEGIIGMTIVDEFHKCKNFTSTQGKAVHCCTSYYKLALTGTPIMNDAIDLYNVLKWLEVEQRSLTAFKNHYCEFGGFGGYEIVRYKNLDELQETLDENMLRRKKGDVLDLPPKIRAYDYVEMNRDQSKLYGEVLQQIMDNIDKVLLSNNPLAEMIRLRQVTGYPGIISSTITKSSKLDRLYEIVEEVVSNGGKCIVFSNWTNITKPVYETLFQFNPALVTSETKDGQAEQDKFMQDDSCKVIIGTIGCLGTGFTLTAANTVIFMDEPFTMAAKEQAEDRAHRIGTKETVHIITLICKDTIDEKIAELVKRKGELSDLIVDNKNSAIEDAKFLLNIK